VTLVVVSWQDLSAEEVRQIEPGDHIRIRAPSIHATPIVGTVLSLNADSLVLKQRKSPFYSARSAIPVHAIGKLEKKTASSGQWERVFALQPGERIVHLPRDFKAYADSVSARGSSRTILNRYLWLNAGIGGSTIEEGIASGWVVSYHHAGKHLISIRFVEAEAIELGFGRERDQPEEKARGIGVLYGRVAQNSAGLASFSAGLGIVTGVRQGKFLRHHSSTPCSWILCVNDEYDIYERETFDTLAIPIEAQLIFMPDISHFRFRLGVGLYGFANWNSELPYWGALLCLTLGTARQ